MKHYIDPDLDKLDLTWPNFTNLNLSDSHSTVLIGLGGSGIACIYQIMELVRYNVNPKNQRDPKAAYPGIACLGIDTEVNTFFEAEEFIYLQDENAKKPEQFLNSHDVVSILQDKSYEILYQINQTVQRARRERFVAKEIDIHVFAGLGGATGASCFLDICYMLHNLLDGLPEKVTYHGYCLLPDIITTQGSNLPTNTSMNETAYKALHDIDLCMKGLGMSVDHPFLQEHTGNSYIRRDLSPVDFCYLVSAFSEESPAIMLPYKAAINEVADFVLMQIIGKKNGNTVSAMLDNSIMIRGAEKGSFMALGASHLENPMQQSYPKLVKTFLDSLYSGKNNSNEQLDAKDILALVLLERDCEFNEILQSLREGASTLNRSYYIDSLKKEVSPDNLDQICTSYLSNLKYHASSWCDDLYESGHANRYIGAVEGQLKKVIRQKGLSFAQDLVEGSTGLLSTIKELMSVNNADRQSFKAREALFQQEKAQYLRRMQRSIFRKNTIFMEYFERAIENVNDEFMEFLCTQIEIFLEKLYAYVIEHLRPAIREGQALFKNLYTVAEYRTFLDTENMRKNAFALSYRKVDEELVENWRRNAGEFEEELMRNLLRLLFEADFKDLSKYGDEISSYLHRELMSFMYSSANESFLQSTSTSSPIGVLAETVSVKTSFLFADYDKYRDFKWDVGLPAYRDNDMVLLFGTDKWGYEVGIKGYCKLADATKMVLYCIKVRPDVEYRNYRYFEHMGMLAEKSTENEKVLEKRIKKEKAQAETMEKEKSTERTLFDFGSSASTKPLPPRSLEPGEKFIFISYAHMDSEFVMPLVHALNEDGYSFWLDQDIAPTTIWDNEIADHISASTFIITFISENYLKSTNCLDELRFMRDEGKKILLVYLDDAKLEPGLAMRLNGMQYIRYNEKQGLNVLYKKIISSKGIEICRR